MNFWHTAFAKAFAYLSGACKICRVLISHDSFPYSLSVMYRVFTYTTCPLTSFLSLNDLRDTEFHFRVDVKMTEVVRQDLDLSRFQNLAVGFVGLLRELKPNCLGL